MPDSQVPSLLSVACSAPKEEELISVGHAETAHRALELMQLLHYDLVVVSAAVSDMTVWNLVQRMRVLAPWQKWLLVGPSISTEAEIAARALGAIAVIDEPGDWRELTQMAQAVARKSRRSLVMAS